LSLSARSNHWSLAAAIVIGTTALMVLGLLPILLAGMVAESRLSLSSIGLGFTLEMLATGAVGSIAGIVLRPRKMRLIAFLALTAFSGLELALIFAKGSVALLVCFLAGIAQGVLLWVAMTAIVAKAETPARWLAILFTLAGVTSFVVTAALNGMVLPRFGVNGGFACVSVIAALNLVLVILIPDQYQSATPTGATPQLAPPMRGWAALLASVLINGASTSVLVSLVPLAHNAGLSLALARTAVSVTIAGQVIGGLLAVLGANVLAYRSAIIAGTLAMLGAWGLISVPIPVWPFLATAFVYGISSPFMAPFLLPMTLDVDSSGRSAAHVGSAILIGGAVGPLVSSYAVSLSDVRASITIGASLLLSGFALVLFLSITYGSKSNRLARA
jgi:DHA1 family inner membrane transport protein